MEQAILEGQGCVVRLAGLYHAQVRTEPILPLDVFEYSPSKT